MSDAKDLRAGIVPDILAILPLRGSVLMPHAVLPLGAGRASSVRLIEEAVQSGWLVGAVMQRDPKEDAPDQGGLFPVGTVTIGEAGAVNAAVLAVQILATADAELQKALREYREEMTEKVTRRAEEIRNRT